MKISNKPKNKWGAEFERLLEERQWSCDKAVTAVRSYQMFWNVHRSTIYRWQSCAEEKIPPRAWKMLEMIQSTPKANIFAEVLQGWLEKINSLDEQLRKMRGELKDIATQITFTKDNQGD
jgi:hypothetical protein